MTPPKTIRLVQSTEGMPRTDPGAPSGELSGRSPIVEFRGVGKSYGLVEALRDVSLEVREGEFLSLLGPSGCGKTTLMRILAGFVTPTTGDVLLDGQSIVGLPPHRRPVNMMFQSYALFPHMTVAGNVGFGLKMDRVPRRETAERVEEALRLVRLEGFADRRPHELSGGQRQRVALARAIVKRPRLVLLDEPLAALDRKLREETQRELVALQSRLGLTFLTVTHDQHEAMTVSDRIAVMKGGRLIQVGPPEEVYERPGSPFVASFLGEHAAFAGVVSRRDGEAVEVACQGYARPFRVQGFGSLGLGHPVVVVVRPERFVLTPRGHAGATSPNTVDGRVVEVAYHGGSMSFQIESEAGSRIPVLRLTRSRSDADVPEVGAAVRLSFRPDDAVLVPAEAEGRA